MPPRLEQIHFPQAPREVQLDGTGLAGASPASPQRERAEYERGRRDAEKALTEQLIQQRAELVEAQNVVLAGLRQAVPQVIGQCEASLIALAVQVAQKLVAGLPVSAEMVEANVREALAQVEATTEFEVHLHPQDLELLQRVNSPLLPGSGPWEKMSLRSSPEVSRGGCLVRTRFGIIDAQPETKLALLRQSLAA